MRPLFYTLAMLSSVLSRRFADIVGTFLLLTSSMLSAESFNHQHPQWTTLLHEHIRVLNNGQASQVDYAGFKKDRKRLQAYLNQLSEVSSKQFSDFNQNQQKAFLINAYNAYTIELILTRYPKLESIRDLGGLFSSPWKQTFIPLLGKTLSLDDIEHGQLRAPDRYHDPRIHFAVNCASVGCPPLREEAFVSDRLDRQLDEQARRFLSDRTRNRFNETSGELQVSNIFDWYGEDFEKGYRGIDSLKNFLAGYAEQLSDAPSAQTMIRKQHIDIDFLEYDWRLNDSRQ